MNVDQLWRALADTQSLPVEAIRTSLDHWDEVSDRYLSKLRALASGAKLSEDDENALFIAVHMFAEKRDKRAYSPLCRLLAEDDEVESWLGDAVTETLPGILINLYDGDPVPLQEVAEASKADVWVRASALEALGYLTRAEKALSDDEMRAYLRGFVGKLSEEDPVIGSTWALVVAALGCDDIAPEVARALSKGLVDAEYYGIKDFHADLRIARDDPEGLAIFKREGDEPFGSTIETLSAWNLDSTKEFDEDGALLEEEGADHRELGSAPSDHLPYVNPLRDIGRNDPCPCGSGKKYKKCCLAA